MSNLAKYQSPKALVEDLQSRSDDLAKYAAAGCNLPRLVQGMASVVQKQPKLLECAPKTLLNAVRHCAQLGLDPSSPLNRIHLVPFYDKEAGCKVATVIVGYGGLVELARRSGEIETIDVQNVYRGESFTFDLGSNPRIDHQPDPSKKRDDNSIIATYGVVWMKDTRHPIIEVMSREQVEGIRKKSKQPDGDAWKWGWGEMARKTVIRRLSKRIPQTPDLEMALSLNDEAEGLRDRPADGHARSEQAMSIESRLTGEPESPPEPVPEPEEEIQDAEIVEPGPEQMTDRAIEIVAQWSGLRGNDLKEMMRGVAKAAGVTARPPLSEDDARKVLAAAERVAEQNKFPDISAAKAQ